MSQRPNTVQNSVNSPLDWYNKIPVVTRYYATAIIFVTLAHNLQVLSVVNLVLSWPLVFKKQQIWRLITDYFVLQYGKLGLGFLFDLVWLIQYGPRLEKEVYFADPPKFLYMFLVAIGAMDIISLVLEFVLGGGPMSMAGSMIFMMMYIYCRENPNQQVSVWGVMNVGQAYLPFVMIGLSLVMGGGNVMSYVVGLMVGHLWWFVDNVYGPSNGVDYLKTPRLISDFYYQYIGGDGRRSGPQTTARRPSVGPQQQYQQQQQQQPQQEGFRAFSGRGYRVG